MPWRSRSRPRPPASLPSSGALTSSTPNRQNLAPRPVTPKEPPLLGTCLVGQQTQRHAIIKCLSGALLSGGWKPNSPSFNLSPTPRNTHTHTESLWLGQEWESWRPWLWTAQEPQRPGYQVSQDGGFWPREPYQAISPLGSRPVHVLYCIPHTSEHG